MINEDRTADKVTYAEAQEVIIALILSYVKECTEAERRLPIIKVTIGRNVIDALRSHVEVTNDPMFARRASLKLQCDDSAEEERTCNSAAD